MVLGRTSLRRIEISIVASALVHAVIVAIVIWGSDLKRFGPVHEITLDLVSPSAPKHEATSIPRKAARIAPSHVEKADSHFSKQPSAAADLAPTADPANSSTPTTGPNVMSLYVGEVMRVLQKNRKYPREAIRREEEGVVSLSVKLEADGNVAEVKVKEPSPFESLNLAALQTVESVGHFPPPPIENGTSIMLTIPMRFKIEKL